MMFGSYRNENLDVVEVVSETRHVVVQARNFERCMARALRSGMR